MDRRDYLHSRGALRTGRRGKRESSFYVPPPIPREVAYDAPVVEALSRADRQLGRLSSIDDLLPNPKLLIVPYMKREAVLSSKIEGTQASLSDVFIEEVHAEGAERPPDSREVLNHVVALEEGVRLVAHRPLGLDTLRHLHAILMKDVRGHEKSPGEFRTEQNWIGPPSLDLATYVPPDVQAMHESLGDLEA